MSAIGVLRADGSFDAEIALELLRVMLRIRRFEERVGELFAAGEMPGFVHLSIGQEAVAAGAISVLRPDDTITATHRGHGQIIAKGGKFAPMMAELYARETGYCRGRGGSMHIFDISLGVLGANGILGAGQPIAVGAALSARFRGTDGVCVTFFGEGASAQGTVHEAMNLAGVWSAPVVFVAEVNGFAELTPYETHVSGPSLAARAAGYAFPGLVVDGSDAIAVRETVGAAVARARAGDGPTLVEARTTRWRGHYEGDPQKYRDGAFEGVDPVAGLTDTLLASGLEPAKLEQVEADIREELDAAVEFARESPSPSPSTLLDDVYTTNG